MISDIDDNILGSIGRLFADDTKVSAKIKNEGDTEILQRDLDEIYKWADENCMEFNENKFEMMSNGNNDVNEPGNYKTKSGEKKKTSKTVNRGDQVLKYWKVWVLKRFLRKIAVPPPTHFLSF